MEFTYIPNRLPAPSKQTNAAISAWANWVLTPELLGQVETRQRYKVKDTVHRIIGVWRSGGAECAVTITQSIEGGPSMALNVVGRVKNVERWEPQRIFPVLFCKQGTGPFMLKVLLGRLELLDETDENLDMKVRSTLEDLAGRYGETQDAKCVEITSRSFQRSGG